MASEGTCLSARHGAGQRRSPRCPGADDEAALRTVRRTGQTLAQLRPTSAPRGVAHGNSHRLPLAHHDHQPLSPTYFMDFLALTHRGDGQVSGIARFRDGDVVRPRTPDQAVPAGRLRSMTKISIDERRASGNRSLSIRSSSPGVLGRDRPSGCFGRFLRGTFPNHSTI